MERFRKSLVCFLSVICLTAYGRDPGLEHVVPDAVFHGESLSNQVTAFAIYLLAQDGKLCLDDDVRKYLPELNDFGKTITIRHLLNHTSGLRDQWALLALTGWRMEDVIAEDDILSLVWRQKTLNFSPGDEFLYSNTGYTLLGVIVKRVSGKSPAAYTKERNIGQLDARKLLAQMQAPVLLNGDREISYASPEETRPHEDESHPAHPAPLTPREIQDREGEFHSDELHVLYTIVEKDGSLVVRHPRGELRLERGSDVDTFKADFPIGTLHYTCTPPRKGCEGFTVSDGQVRNLWFMRASREDAVAKVNSDVLDSIVGYYQFAPDVIGTITRDGDHLYSQVTEHLKYELYPASDREYFSKAADFHATFVAGLQGNVAGLVIRHDGHLVFGQRVDESTAKDAEDFVRRRVAENVPMSGSEAVLRGILKELRTAPDYTRMIPTLARTVRASLPEIQWELASLGEAKSFEFSGIGSRGEDVYAVHFPAGDAEWRILLTGNEMVAGLEHHTFEKATPLPVTHVGALRTRVGGEPTTLEFLNRTGNSLRVYRIDPDGEPRRHGTVEPYRMTSRATHVSEVWMIGTDEHHPVAVFEAAPGLTVGTIN